MILVRDVFRLQFGKASEATADSHWRCLHHEFIPLAESGYREIFTIVP